ncbi:MAG: caspase family protein [Lentimicrobiaceae bacterium]|nr:caspase family protein [Lentimicrobiaceae bacterium]
MSKIFIIILLCFFTCPVALGQNIALTKSKPVRMVRPESGYRLFVKAYVENELDKWQKKDIGESNANYNKRVNESRRNEMIKILEEEAKDKYLQEISKTFVLNFSIRSYDEKQETMLLKEAVFGDINLKVPLNESDNFIKSWSSIDLNPEFFINNDTLGLARVLFSLPEGKSYTYINKAILDSMYMGVPYLLTPIYIIGKRTRNTAEDGRLTNIEQDIPILDSVNSNTWVVIIANEHYRYESKVRYAKNDAEIFKNYCVKTFGVPKKNIRYIQNASLNDFEMTMKWLSGIAKRYGDKTKILFYYTGHGMSSNRNNKSYFVPVDGTFDKIKTCFGVDLLLDNLGAMPIHSAVIFVDAGFVYYNKFDKEKNRQDNSKISIRSNNQLVNGNVVLCLAAQNDETAFLYDEKKHGLFTYFLLNEIQNNPYNIKLGNLFYEVQSKVKTYSLSEYKSMQTPTIIYSASMKDKWKEIEF